MNLDKNKTIYVTARYECTVVPLGEFENGWAEAIAKQYLNNNEMRYNFEGVYFSDGRSFRWARELQ